MTISELQVVTTALWVLAGTWLRSISRHTIHTSIIGSKYGKIAIYRPGIFVRGILVCDCRIAVLCSDSKMEHKTSKVELEIGTKREKLIK